MKTFIANEAKTRFRAFFEAMRAFYADRLSHNLDEAARASERAGMTPELLETLLADES